ncbi:hypothetical protein V6Z12_A08G045000 [Gossypium hirsutum]
MHILNLLYHRTYLLHLIFVLNLNIFPQSSLPYHLKTLIQDIEYGMRKNQKKEPSRNANDDKFCKLTDCSISLLRMISPKKQEIG